MSHKKLLDHEDILQTEMGKAFLCHRVVLRGADLHHDLSQMDWFSFYLFTITGRKFSENELKLLNYLWVSTSYPDPSIWPNHLSALAGSVRTTPSLALTAGLGMCEANLFGGRPLRRSIDFFLRAGKALKQGQLIEAFVDCELRERKTLFGYGRPLAKMDERIPHTLHTAKELGFGDGYHLNIALDVYRYLKQTKGLSMNIVALDGALGADLGFSPEEFQLYMYLCFFAGQIPCYLDSINKPEGSFFPTRCDKIVYQGVAKRSW